MYYHRGMKRLVAGLVLGGLLALSGLETLHHHATLQQSDCSACSLELQATGAQVAVVATPAPTPVWSEAPAVQGAVAVRSERSAASARAPPSAA
jgi:hypothetical protein